MDTSTTNSSRGARRSRRTSTCARVVPKSRGLRRTRQHLTTWAPPEPEFNFHIVRGAAAPPPARRWFGSCRSGRWLPRRACSCSRAPRRSRTWRCAMARTGSSCAPAGLRPLQRPASAATPGGDPAAAAAVSSEQLEAVVQVLENRLLELERAQSRADGEGLRAGAGGDHRAGTAQDPGPERGAAAREMAFRSRRSGRTSAPRASPTSLGCRTSSAGLRGDQSAAASAPGFDRRSHRVSASAAALIEAERAQRAVARPALSERSESKDRRPLQEGEIREESSIRRSGGDDGRVDRSARAGRARTAAAATPQPRAPRPGVAAGEPPPLDQDDGGGAVARGARRSRAPGGTARERQSQHVVLHRPGARAWIPARGIRRVLPRRDPRDAAEPGDVGVDARARSGRGERARIAAARARALPEGARSCRPRGAETPRAAGRTDAGAGRSRQPDGSEHDPRRGCSGAGR